LGKYAYENFMVYSNGSGTLNVYVYEICQCYNLFLWFSISRDSWVKRIDEESKNYLAVDRKKRERAHSCKYDIFISYRLESLHCYS
jgi:hypothetical protein